jgi:hypothetical protein
MGAEPDRGRETGAPMTMLTAFNRLAELARNDRQPERSAEVER